MKFGLALFLLVLIGACATTPVTTEYMIISPKTITFDKFADTNRTVSITHSCTCPFSWHSQIPDTSVHWIVFPSDTVGDHSSIPIKVMPSLMPRDTNTARIAINSDHGTYGSDTITVVAFR